MSGHFAFEKLFLFTYNILDEQNPITKPKREFIKEFNILEKIVVASPGVTVLVIVPVDQ